MPRNHIISRIAFSGLGLLTQPQDPREFIQLFNPLASSHYTRGIVTEVHREAEDTATISFTTGEGWQAHRAGQWARIGVKINGRRVWRPYSISSAEHEHPSITVRAQGQVSEALVHNTQPGDILYLEKPAGQFLLENSPTALLFLTAGSGITPVMSMLRTLMPRRPNHDVVLIHSDRSPKTAIFREEILELADQFPGLRAHFHFTGLAGRIKVGDAAGLEKLCPDFRDRTIYTCGPDTFVTGVEKAAQTVGEKVVLERFDTRLAPTAHEGPGSVLVGSQEIEVPAGVSILEACESAGQNLPHGCRAGVCKSCSTMMEDGVVMDMRTGELTSEPGMIQTCMTRPSPTARLQTR